MWYDVWCTECALYIKRKKSDSFQELRESEKNWRRVESDIVARSHSLRSLASEKRGFLKTSANQVSALLQQTCWNTLLGCTFLRWVETAKLELSRWSPLVRFTMKSTWGKVGRWVGIYSASLPCAGCIELQGVEIQGQLQHWQSKGRKPSPHHCQQEWSEIQRKVLRNKNTGMHNNDSWNTGTQMHLRKVLQYMSKTYLKVGRKSIWKCK